MPRFVYFAGLGLALVALALGFTDWALSLQAGVTERNARRIHKGMTLQEVELILGGPPSQQKHLWGRNSAFTSRICVWIRHPEAVLVALDRRGQVTAAEWLRDKSAPRPLSRLRAWLGW